MKYSVYFRVMMDANYFLGWSANQGKPAWSIWQQVKTRKKNTSEVRELKSDDLDYLCKVKDKLIKLNLKGSIRKEFKIIKNEI